MKSALPIILIVAGLVLGIWGFTKLDDSSASLSVGDVSVSATDEGGRNQAYLLMGLGVLSLIGGGVMVSKSK